MGPHRGTSSDFGSDVAGGVDPEIGGISWLSIDPGMGAGFGENPGLSGPGYIKPTRFRLPDSVPPVRPLPCSVAKLDVLL
jgi:hypothetical protein